MTLVFTRSCAQVSLYGVASTAFTSTGLAGDRTLLDPDAVLGAELSYRVPVVDHSYQEYPPNVEMFVYPRGVRLFRAKPQASLHSFVLTLVRLLSCVMLNSDSVLVVQGNGRRMYGCSCTMWKPVTHKQLSTIRLQIAARSMSACVGVRLLAGVHLGSACGGGCGVQ